MSGAVIPDCGLQPEYLCVKLRILRNSNEVQLMTESLDKVEKKTFEEDDNSEVPPTDIVAFNELRSCSDLFRMKSQSILEINPDFQRDFVWSTIDQTRFIDSLIKQLPIPSMCFAQDYGAQKWIVIDGLQRISTIIKFLEGGDWTLSVLDDIDPEIAGKSVAAIKTSKTSLHQYYTRIENLTIPITVLRCSFNKKSHMEYLFTIFHRLNTGGMKLTNQEIRNCIYGGPFNNLLKELDKNKTWRVLNKMKTAGNYRFAKQEIALRFFAFQEKLGTYDGQLAKFLNGYMHDHRRADQGFLDDKKRLFERTAIQIYEKIFSRNLPKRLPVTILEAILVGVGSNIDHVESQSEAAAKANYNLLINESIFSESSLLEGLSKRKSVTTRLQASVLQFSK